MASKVGGLGRGLDALMGSSTVMEQISSSLRGGQNTSALTDDKGDLVQGEGGAALAGGRKPSEGMLISIDPALLDPNPEQPRREFNDETLQELCQSIKEHGVLQPIIAEAAEGGRYRIVAGERRTKAAIMAGVHSVPVIVKNYNEEKRLLVALIENIQRADLNPIEEAAAYEKLMAMGALSQEELAQRVGKKRSTVANAMRLLNLNSEMKEALKSGAITAGHARALLSVEGEKEREALFHRILDEGLNVREVEAAAKEEESKRQKATGGGGEKDGNEGKNTKHYLPLRDPDIVALEEQMLEKHGTKCHINGSLTKGKIEIDYYSRDELDRLCAILT